MCSELRAENDPREYKVPDVGEEMVVGRLRSLGYQANREHIRQAIRDTDPINSALRWQGVPTTRHPLFSAWP